MRNKLPARYDRNVIQRDYTRLAIGYTLGYKDAYRGPSSLGWILGDMVDRMKPDAISAARANNAAAIRQQQRQNLPAVLQD